MNISVLGIVLWAAGLLLLVIFIAITQKNINRMKAIIERGQQEATDRQERNLFQQEKQLEALNRQLNTTMVQVSKSMGEMESMAQGIRDIRRIMTNVKTRGIMGEVQLASIIGEILAPGQYEENVAVTGSRERVEFAIKFPGEDGGCVYMPVDSKFPADAYINLLDAYEEGDRDKVKRASDQLRMAIIKAARDIKTKYIYPPYTTEFGIMFLPFEGLYAEVLRMNLVEVIQREYKVNIAGPTTMAAMVNSFQMGFKSLALQQSSGEVWNTLEKIKSEFEAFGDVLEKTQKKLEGAQKDLETLVGVRTRTIRRTLEKVSEHTGYDDREER